VGYSSETWDGAVVGCEEVAVGPAEEKGRVRTPPRVFIHGERGTMRALPGKHDDRVVAFTLANIAISEKEPGEIVTLSLPSTVAHGKAALVSLFNRTWA
jgi:hypothetical protein